MLSPFFVNTLLDEDCDGLVVTPAHLSTKLTTFMGIAFCPRSHVTRKIWAYIKEFDLQNPLDRREILCDSTLQDLFGRKKFSMLKMTKYLSRVNLQDWDHSRQLICMYFTEVDVRLLSLLSMIIHAWFPPPSYR